MISSVGADLPRVGVVIPAYRVSAHVMDVLADIPEIVTSIYVVDDACPDTSGRVILEQSQDPRVRVLFHPVNRGVGGAMITGYQAALDDGMSIIVKIDGDGQMNPCLVPDFISPILEGQADYTKGNRFFDVESVRAMPRLRLFGNAVLSFLNKLSSGYWDIFDPTNGYTAIHADVLRRLPLGKISQRYFFESDMLFRLNTIRAVVHDVPMQACYGDEVSNLKISRILGEFLRKHIRNFGKRIFYNYYLRDVSLASLELPLGLVMMLFGMGYGVSHWLQSLQSGVATAPGTVMLAALPLLMGLQLLLAFLGYDIASTPKNVIHRKAG